MQLLRHNLGCRILECDIVCHTIGQTRLGILDITASSQDLNNEVDDIASLN